MQLLTLAILFSTLLIALLCVVCQDRLRKRATERTRILAQFLFFLPLVASFTLPTGLASFERAYGETFGHPIFMLTIGGCVVGMALYFALSFDLRHVGLPETRDPKDPHAVTTDPGAYV